MTFGQFHLIMLVFSPKSNCRESDSNSGFAKSDVGNSSQTTEYGIIEQFMTVWDLIIDRPSYDDLLIKDTNVKEQ